MTSVAIIPARGDSKRIANKNIRPFFGHPMLAYTVAASMNSNIFERVIVSTDDPFTGRIAQWYGAEYLTRPKALATDEASLVDVALHVIETLESENSKPDVLCQLMPNCPLRRSEDIVAHHRLFVNEGRSFQISVVPYRCVYPHWGMTTDHEGTGRWLFGSSYLVPSQQLEKAYCPTGAIWLTKVSDFVRQRAFYGEPFHLVPMDANRGIDIDHYEELDFAEIIVEGLTNRDGISPLEEMDKSPFHKERND
jgi:CMP-N-acetylneuraminic acid synthetase